MDRNDFEQVFTHIIEHAEATLLTKSQEYADDTDRLHNFKVAAGIVQGTSEQALWGFAAKHFTSLSDMVKSEDFFPADVWDEKIGDSINYLILLRALVLERNMTEPSAVNPRHAQLGEVHFNDI